ncbi:MAG TPA: IS6 family transposase, partial [Acetobacteraceae bacterium]|nr:IS6 family transposase [Acetobacteraceae bacterium]
CKKSGRSFASRLRRGRPRPGDKWHLDEVFVRIHGVQHYLWRGVDQHGVVLDILVQERRDAEAAKRFFRRLLTGLDYVPRVIVTDQLSSYGVAKRHLLPDVEQRQSRYLNNRAENSHRPTRRRERQMQRCKSPEQAQDLLSAHAFIHGHFHPRRHLTHIVRSGLWLLRSGTTRHAPDTRHDALRRAVLGSISSVRSQRDNALLLLQATQRNGLT